MNAAYSTPHIPYWIGRHDPDASPKRVSLLTVRTQHTRGSETAVRRSRISKPVRIDARILSLLSDGAAMSIDELSEVLDIPADRIARTLQRLHDNKQVRRTRPQRGPWRYRRTDSVARDAIFRSTVAPGGSRADQVLATLANSRQRWHTAAAIAAAIDASPRSIHTPLRQLVERGELTRRHRAGKFEYALPTTQEPSHA